VSRARGAAWGTAALLVAAILVAAACGGGADPGLGSTDDSAPGTAAPGSPSTAPGAPTTSTSPPSTTSPDADDEVEVTSGLPEGWPDDLPIPSDAVLGLGQRTEQDDGQVLLTADFTVGDDGANVYTAFLGALEDDADTTILQRSSGDTDSGFVGSVSFERGDYSGNVAVDTATGTTILSVSVVLDG
jgi:hypothetical protein